MIIRDVASLGPSGFRPRAAAAEQNAEPQDRVDVGGGKARPQYTTRLQAMLVATESESVSLATKLAPHREGEVLVKFNTGANLGTIEDFASEYGAEVLEKIEVPPTMAQAFGGQLVRVSMPAGVNTAQGIAVLSKDVRVHYAASNDLLEAYGDEGSTLIPNDLDPRLWGLNNTGQDNGTPNADINAPEAWTLTTGKRDGGPVICVIDTGLNYNHNDLKNNVWTNPGEIPGDGIDNDGNGVVDDVHGFNAINGSGNPLDDHSHGSHCMGTIAAEGNNGLGVVGINWQARVMGAKFLSGQGSGTTADAIKAVLYASKMGARITSNSWGGGAYNQALYDALKASPALHIFAAGNSSSDNDKRASYPASYDLDNIVAVAATDKNDRLAGFSNYGRTTVDLGAPGVNILSTVLDQDYKMYSGTSMATPHVAGVAGLIATQFPGSTNAEIKARLMNGADKVPSLEGKCLTGARLNAFNSLDNDTTAPDAPADLRVEKAGAKAVTLAWTATGDDGSVGRASAYVLKVSEQPITEENFGKARTVPTSQPNVPGSAEKVTVGLIPSASERTLYYALKVADNVGNTSPLLLGQTQVPAARVAFEDRMEGDASQWIPQGQWARTEWDGHGKVWTDSPDAPYNNDSNTSLTSKPISLAGVSGATLLFDARYEIESGFDFLNVEASENGKDWTTLGRLTGSREWGTNQMDLSAYDGKNIQVRFRMQADGSINADGFYLDNVVVAGDPKPGEV